MLILARRRVDLVIPDSLLRPEARDTPGVPLLCSLANALTRDRLFRLGLAVSAIRRCAGYTIESAERVSNSKFGMTIPPQQQVRTLAYIFTHTELTHVLFSPSRLLFFYSRVSILYHLCFGLCSFY